MDILDGLRRWWARRNAASTPEREPTDPSPIPKWQERLNEWMHRVHFPPITFRAELWRDPKDNPDLPALAAKYGDDQAEGEVQFLQSHLLREVVMAAVGLLHTLEKIETLMAELQAFADEQIERWPEDEPWPEFGHGIAHPLVVEASFEFINLVIWLRMIEERLDRKWQPGRPERVGLLPELADRPVRSRVKTLVDDFHVKARERELANYALHAGVVPQALGGADLSRDHRVTLKVPDRSSDRIDTPWHLTYDDEREALALARQAGEAVESLIAQLIVAFEEESRSIDEERARNEASRRD